MVWFHRTINIVDVSDLPGNETERMWRQIDPEIHDRMLQ